MAIRPYVQEMLNKVPQADGNLYTKVRNLGLYKEMKSSERINYDKMKQILLFLLLI